MTGINASALLAGHDLSVNNTGILEGTATNIFAAVDSTESAQVINDGDGQGSGIIRGSIGIAGGVINVTRNSGLIEGIGTEGAAINGQDFGPGTNIVTVNNITDGLHSGVIRANGQNGTAILAKTINLTNAAASAVEAE